MSKCVHCGTKLDLENAKILFPDYAPRYCQTCFRNMLEDGPCAQPGCIHDRQRERIKLEQGGDNFRFVRWGGLADLSLWRKR